MKGLSELAEMPEDELHVYLNKQTKKSLITMLLDEFLNEVDESDSESESESETE